MFGGILVDWVVWGVSVDCVVTGVSVDSSIERLFLV